MPVRPGDDFDRDILDIIPERFDADADSHQARAGHRLRSALTLALAVVVVGGIVAAGLHFAGNRQAGSGGIPVIKADDRPIKIRPQDPGGMQVPNQDKLVYERMDGQSEAHTERLLAPPEQPMLPPPGAAAPPAESAAPVPAAPPAPAPPPAAGGYSPVESRPAAPPPTALAAALPPPAPAASAPSKPAPARAESRREAEARPAHVAQAVAVPHHKAPPAGDYVVQLGAVRSAEAADREWKRIEHANAEQLAGLKPDIVRVDLRGKGTFWRIRAGSLSEEAARALCRELSQRNQGCIVARK